MFFLQHEGDLLESTVRAVRRRDEEAQMRVEEQHSRLVEPLRQAESERRREMAQLRSTADELKRNRDALSSELARMKKRVRLMSSAHQAQQHIRQSNAAAADDHVDNDGGRESSDDPPGGAPPPMATSLPSRRNDHRLAPSTAAAAATPTARSSSSSSRKKKGREDGFIPPNPTSRGREEKKQKKTKQQQQAENPMEEAAPEEEAALDFLSLTPPAPPPSTIFHKRPHAAPSSSAAASPPPPAAAAREDEEGCPKKKTRLLNLVATTEDDVDAPLLSRVVSVLSKRLGAVSLFALGSCSKALSAIVDDPRLRPWAKRAHVERLRLARRSLLLLKAEYQSKRERRGLKYAPSHALYLAGESEEERPLVALDEIASSFSSFEAPPDVRLLEGLVRDSPALAEAWSAAQALARNSLGVEEVQGWVAAACFVLCCGGSTVDARTGSVMALALEALTLCCKQRLLVGEFGCALLCRCIDGGWAEARFRPQTRLSAVGALVLDLGGALDIFFAEEQKLFGRSLLTAEQELVCGAALDPAMKSLLVVRAYAGTGKTHTVLEFCRRRNSHKVIVAYFNRSMAEETRQRLKKQGINAECRTCDAFVAREFVDNHPLLKHKFNDDTEADAQANLTSKMILRAIGVETVKDKMDPEDAMTIANHTKRVLLCWCSSLKMQLADGDEEILPGALRKWWSKKKRMPPLAKYARLLWRRIISLDPVNLQYRMSYVELAKAYALREQLEESAKELDWMIRGLEKHGTVLHGLLPFRLEAEYYVIDEAQDTNPTHFELFVSAPRRDPGRRVAHVLLGDAFQSLYGWRGATNALRDAEPLATSPVVTLTHSFRFGFKLAQLATLLLRSCSDSDHHRSNCPRLVGRGPQTRVHFDNRIHYSLPADFTKKEHDDSDNKTVLAALGRTNRAVLAAAEEYAKLAGSSRKLIFVRGLNLEAHRSVTKDLLGLRKDPNRRADFGSEGSEPLGYAQLLDLWKQDALQDDTLKRAIELVEDIGDASLDRIDLIAGASAKTPEEALVQLATVHQFKGLQTTAVRVLDDAWAPVVDSTGEPMPISDANLCLIYTALTRVQNDLYVPNAIQRLSLWNTPLRCVPRWWDGPACSSDSSQHSHRRRREMLTTPIACASCSAPLVPQRAREASWRAMAAADDTRQGVCRDCAILSQLQRPFAPPILLTQGQQRCRFLAGWRVFEDDDDEDLHFGEEAA